MTPMLLQGMFNRISIQPLGNEVPTYLRRLHYYIVCQKATLTRCSFTLVLLTNTNKLLVCKSTFASTFSFNNWICAPLSDGGAGGANAGGPYWRAGENGQELHVQNSQRLHRQVKTVLLILIV